MEKIQSCDLKMKKREEREERAAEWLTDGVKRCILCCNGFTVLFTGGLKTIALVVQRDRTEVS